MTCKNLNEKITFKPRYTHGDPVTQVRRGRHTTQRHALHRSVQDHENVHWNAHDEQDKRYPGHYLNRDSIRAKILVGLTIHLGGLFDCSGALEGAGERASVVMSVESFTMVGWGWHDTDRSPSSRRENPLSPSKPLSRSSNFLQLSSVRAPLLTLRRAAEVGRTGGYVVCG